MKTQPETKPKRCEDCKFWTPWPKQPNPEMTIGDCRRHAPQIFQTDPGNRKPFVTKFPSTQDNEFCGSFKAKPTEAQSTFPEWFAQLKKIAPAFYNLAEADAQGPEAKAWFDYFDEGLTPQRALNEDLSQA